MTDISTWSPVDASNNAAPPAGWPENMQPSAVNDCARAMMGAIRRYYDSLLSGSFVLPYLPITGGAVTGNITAVNINATGQINAVGAVTAGSSSFSSVQVTGPGSALNVTNGGTIGSLTLTGTGTAALNVPNGGGTLGGLTLTGGSGNVLSIPNGGSIAVAGGLSAGSSIITSIRLTGTGYSLDVPVGAINVAGYSNFSNGFTVAGTINAGGQLNLTAGGNSALNVPSGGITVAGHSSFPWIYGGPGAAGTLQCFNTADRVCFRWDTANLFLRVDETLEQRIPYANNFNGFDLGSGGASPTGYDLAAYASGAPYILHIDIVSDRRLKENVRDTQVDALGALLATPVRAFDWSEAGRRYMPYIDPHAPIGLVAQEVQETMPWVVGVSNFKESDDVPVHDMHRVLHDRLTAYLVRAVQQLSARIDSLTTGENHV